MIILLKSGSDEPLYNQISAQIKNQIIKGDIKTGDALPSIRLLAKDLKISVITTARAYEELEKEGFIVTVTGKGCYVAELSGEKVREEQLNSIQKYIEPACRIAKSGGISKAEIIKMIDIIYE